VLVAMTVMLVVAMAVASATATTAMSNFKYFSPLARGKQFKWHHSFLR
jgi:hypothetical protein